MSGVTILSVFFDVHKIRYLHVKNLRFQSQNIWKPNNLKIFGSKKTNDPISVKPLINFLFSETYMIPLRSVKISGHV